MAAVIPFPRGHVMPVVAEPIAPPPIPRALCPVCEHPTGPTDWHCNGCAVVMCEPCYWGRVATLAEWRDYLTRWIEPEEYNSADVPVVCPACRGGQEV